MTDHVKLALESARSAIKVRRFSGLWEVWQPDGVDRYFLPRTFTTRRDAISCALRCRAEHAALTWYYLAQYDGPGDETNLWLVRETAVEAFEAGAGWRKATRSAVAWFASAEGVRVRSLLAPTDQDNGVF